MYISLNGITRLTRIINWCPYCWSQLKYVKIKNCVDCYNKSIASLKKKTSKGKLKVDCWDLTKINNIPPREIFKSSRKKYWFNCDVCHHSFNIRMREISSLDNWCSYCGGKQLCSNEKSQRIR